MYMVQHIAVCRAMATQYLLSHMGALLTVPVTPPLSLAALVAVALRSTRSGYSPQDGELHTVAERIALWIARFLFRGL